MYVLLTKLRHVFASGDPNAYLLPDEALTAYMNHCSTRVGDAYFRTPRTTIKEFVNLLAILEQNPNVEWSDLIVRVEIVAESNPDLAPLIDDEPDDVPGTGPSILPPPPPPKGDVPPPPLAASGDDDDLTNLRL
jgi:hypothetical protein